MLRQKKYYKDSVNSPSDSNFLALLKFLTSAHFFFITIIKSPMVPLLIFDWSLPYYCLLKNNLYTPPTFSKNHFFSILLGNLRKCVTLPSKSVSREIFVLPILLRFTKSFNKTFNFIPRDCFDLAKNLEKIVHNKYLSQ